MLYKPFQDLQLSALGMGAMRLPVVEGTYDQIDMAETERMVAYAMANGVNYYDTAYGYHDGQSEIAMGKVLGQYSREQYYLADKFPGYDLANMDKVEAIFEEQLQKCAVTYFDFYLFHNVCEMNIEAYLDEQYGIMAYLLKQKAAGRIKHLGFSVHGSYDVMKRFLEAYGIEMEFCQIQLNYVDWAFQEAKAKVALLEIYQIPIWVMEPLRGGMLANLPVDYTQQLQAMRPEETIPAWAFRFLQSVPGVTMILSGMSNLQQLQQNINTFMEDKPLNQDECAKVFAIAAEMTKKTALPCTGCRYCTGHCPQQLDIPSLLALYNEHIFTGGGFLAPMHLSSLPSEKQPSACIGCKNCEALCPQQINVSAAMQDFAKVLQG